MIAELEFAVALARRAGDLVLPHFRSRDLDVQIKDDGGPVTAADRAADEFLRAELERAYPGDAILSEEHPDDPARLGRSRLWLVDPIDGTESFVAGVPEFAIMIGRADEGRATLGVVHMPVEDWTVGAIAGGGAWEWRGENARRLALPFACADPERIRVAVSRQRARTRTARLLEALPDARWVPSGSLGRKGALVASGQADLFVTLGSRSRHWDACAVDAVVAEAGGRFVTARGEPLAYNTRDTRNAGGLIAGRGEAVERILAALRAGAGQ